jgi:NarL family two-component system response regulator LiaR
MLTSNRVTVMIVDKSDLVRREMAAYLSTNDDFELIAEAGSCAEAGLLCAQLHPDVILMDMVLPDTEEASMMECINETYPDIQIIALTNYKDEELMRTALEVGSIGYLLKSVSMMEASLAAYLPA